MKTLINNIKIRLNDWKILRNMERLTKPGEIIIQQSGPRTGKSERARKWEAKDPENRRVVDGDETFAYILANSELKPAVCLNLLPGM